MVDRANLKGRIELSCGRLARINPPCPPFYKRGLCAFRCIEVLRSGDRFHRDIRERLSCKSCLDTAVNGITDVLKIPVYCIIREADHCNPQQAKPLCTFSVLRGILHIVVLSAIKLYNQMCSSAVEVDDIVVQRVLPRKSRQIPTQGVVPQVPLFLRHIPSERLCGLLQFWVIFPNCFHRPFDLWTLPAAEIVAVVCGDRSTFRDFAANILTFFVAFGGCAYSYFYLYYRNISYHNFCQYARKNFRFLYVKNAQFRLKIC